MRLISGHSNVHLQLSKKDNSSCTSFLKKGMFVFAACMSMLSSGMMHLIRALRFINPSSSEVAMALWGATAVISAIMAAFLVVYLPFLSALDLEVFPLGETASVGTLLNTKLAEEEERSVRIVSELIARHEDEKDKIRAASTRQEELLLLLRHEMAALGANVNDRMQMMTRNTIRMADCNAQLIMSTRPVVEQIQVIATPWKLNPSPLLLASL
jgi:hypothetical protein